ncbi:hypothetical protein [Halorarum salinum]|uniref:DUF8107 domain-containing protein n=1 Tax=Halorarum salinum TaxID=2743089 RepID=A0A7D5QIC6_9EURY|nr:hypothetical protein [Halobaculum salinum]QLG60605.1 hypothetical protein HUG12_02130 [Halobaculum salinum]
MASDGDIRVLLVLDLLLSAAFVYVALTALSFVGLAEFTTWNFGVGTAVVAGITYFLVLRG